MASNGNFKIRLGVQLDPNALKGLRSEIKNAKFQKIKLELNASEGIKNVKKQVNGAKFQKIKLEFNVNSALKDLKRQIRNTKFPKIKIELNTKTAESQIKALKGQLNGVSKTNAGAGSGGSKNANRQVNEMTTAYNKLKNITKNINSIKVKLNGLDTSKDIQQIKTLEKQLQGLRKEYLTTVSKIKGKGDLSSAQWQSISQQIDNTKIKLDQLSSKIADAKAKLAKGVQIKLDNGSFQNSLHKIETDFDKLKIKSKDLKAAMAELRAAMESLNTAKTDSQRVAAAERYERALKDVNNQLEMQARVEREAANAAKAKANAENLNLKKTALHTDIDDWLKNNSAAVNQFGARLRDIQSRIKACDAAGLKNLRAEFTNVKKQADLAGKATQTLGDRLRTQFQRYSAYFSVASAFMYITQGLRDMFQQVVAIDSAMVELRKVTDETNATYNKFLTDAAETASKIGTTIDGLVSSTADFARLGYEFTDAADLAQVANIYTVVGDEIDSVDTATQSLISTMKAFKDEAGNVGEGDFAMDIVDKMNEVSNNFAISSGGIGEALTRSASSLAAANNSLDESIALITASNTVVQDPTVVGTALKTISMRIRGAKTEMEEAGLETEGMAESTAKLREEIMALSGVDIMLDKNTFKSTYQIMEEIAGKWEQLTDIQQASVTELIAGKRQGNIVSSLMTNFDIAQDALQTSLDSSGSATREHEKWLQSLEAKINQLKAAWQGLSQAFMSSDFLKNALDVIIKLVEGLTLMIDKVGALPTLLAGFAMFKGMTGKGIFGFDKATQQFNLFGKGINQIRVGLANYNSAANKTTAINSAMSQSIPSFTNYLTGLKGANASMGGYIKSAALGAVKTAAMSVATGLLTGGLMALATGAIVLVAKGIDTLIVSQKELAEEVDNVVSSYNEQHGALMKVKGDFDTSNASSLASRYKELSKGVDGLGRNISLTADEYSEYQSICNSIAEQVPSLVSGYDEHGNAILTCKGNVEALTEAYQKLIHAQNQDILTNAGDIEKDFANELKKQSGEHWYSNGHGFWNPLVGSFGNYELKNDTVKNLEDWLNATSKSEKDKALSRLKDDAYSAEELRDALTSAGIEVGFFDNVWKELEKAYEKDPQKIKGIIDNYSAQFDELVNQQKTIAQAKLSEAFDVDSAISGMDYSGISENLQAVAYSVIGSFDYDFLSQLSEQGKSIESWVADMLDQLNAISDADSAEIDAAFNLQTKFNDNDISYGGYVEQIRDISNTIDSLNVSDEVKSQIKLALNTEEVTKEYNRLKKRLTSEKYDIQLESQEAEDFLNSLTSEELSVFTQIIPELSKNGVNETVDDLRAEIEKAMAMNPPTIDIAVETERLETLTSVITESLSGVGLSGEATSAIESMFNDLTSYDSSKLFERTANGIRLNSDELRRLNNEYADTNMSALNNKMSDLGDLYTETQLELAGLTYGTEEYNQKVGELSAIEAQINSVETLATQYKGLTSAYNQWQQAEAAGQQRDMYESVISGLENIDDEISRGWVDDATIEFLELLSGQDLSTAGIDKIKKAYKGLDDTIKNTTYSVRDFFTVDDEGNSTNAGVYNFLDAVGQLEEEKFGGKDIVQRDKKGNIIGFDFQIAGGDEVIAEALGVSEELVQIMVRAADDAGFVVSMDGTYQQLDILKEKAQKAAESLKGIMGKDGVDFNFNASTIEEITPQLKEAEKILDSFRNKDGSINLEMEGAEEAFTVASTLQSMLDKLTRPAYMDIQTSQVDKELQKPLENLQEYRRLVETEHQLKLSGADTSELEKSKSEILDYFEDIQANNPELAVELGIDGDSRKELEKKISEGEFEIPATVDIQMEMDDKLGILVDKALLEAGIIDKKEFKKRVDIYLDADVDNKDAKDKTDKAVKEVADGKGEKSSGKDGKSSSKKVKKNVDVEVKADKVDTSDVKKKADDAVKKNNKGEKKKAQKKTDVEVKADKIDTSDIDDKTKDAIEKASEKTSAIGKEIDLEVTLDEYKEIIQGLEDADKDIVIDVKVKGLNDVKELNKNIDLATKIKGDVKNLSEFVKGAKALSKLDNNIETNVTADIEGNVVDEFEYKIDNLKVFADSAKGLKDVGIVLSKVTANIEGNVTDEFEYKIDNLKVFADSAKDLGKIGVIKSEVTANIEGNVTDFLMTEERIDNLKVFADSAKNISSIGVVESKVTANIDGNVTGFLMTEERIDNLKTFSDSAKEVGSIGTVSSSVEANIKGDVIWTPEGMLNNLKEFAEGAKALADTEDISRTIEANIKGDVIWTPEGMLDNLKEFSEGAETLSNIEDVARTVEANIKGDVIWHPEGMLDNLEVFANSAETVKDIGDIEASVTANIDGDVIWHPEGMLNNLKEFSEGAEAISGIGEIEASVTANIDGDVVWTPEGMLNNLKEFAEGAEVLKDTEDIDRSIAANIKGDVIWHPEGMLDNLEVFAEGAKELVNISDVERTITANIDGDAIWHPEAMLNNLKEFSEGAKDLANTSDVSRTVEAKVKGDVIWTPEGMLNNIKSFAKSAKELQDVEDKKVTIEADVKGNVIWTPEGMINNVKTFAKSAKELSGVEDSISKEIKANIYGNVGSASDGTLDNLRKFTNRAIELKEVGSPTSTVTANIEGNIDNGKVSTLEKFAGVAAAVKSVASVAVKVTAEIASTAIENAITLLQKVSDSGLFKNYSAKVTVATSIDSTAVDTYQPPKKTGSVQYQVDSSVVDAWKAPKKEGKITYTPRVKALTDKQKNKTGTITYKAKITGFPVVNGTANINGSAFADGTTGRAFKQGDWGVKETTTALTGELGQELVVYGNRYWTVGDNGAEFATIPKGAIVFNHKQTEELFKNGRVTSGGGRGIALASGTAFNGGSTGSGGIGKVEGNSVTVQANNVNVVNGSGSGSNSSSKSSSSSSSSSKEADEFKETIDWIEIAIDRIQRAIDKLDLKASSIYKTWSTRNSALKDEIGKVREEIDLQQRAYNRYMQEANSVGLSENWAAKVRNGEINIQDITDESLKEKIDEYQEWYNKALDCSDAIDELREKEAKLYQQRFDNVATEYEGILGVIEHEKNMLDEFMAQSEAKGRITSANYYKAQISNEQERIATLQEEKARLTSELEAGLASGAIEVGSEAYMDMVSDIDDVTLAIEESNTAILELNNSIRDTEWEVFDMLQERISDVAKEADFMIELMSSKKLYNDNGQLTNEGMATMGLHGQNYNVYMAQADKYGKEIADLDKEIAKDPLNQDLINRRRELLELQQESITAAEGEKEAIHDMVEEGIELELDALQERIDKYNEAIESQKDLYDYQKKVKEQTKEIASLEKQMAAYSGDMSEEAKAKIQELKVSLEEAEADLEETEYERYISDQQALLDELYLEYETILNSRLDNIDALLTDMIDKINANASTISMTLSTEAANVGYTLSESMKTIWSENSNGTKNVITTYGDKFATAQTTTNNALNTININLQNMITQLNKIAKTDVKSASTSSAANSVKPSEESKTTTTPTPTTTSANTIKVGGKINAGNAQIYDYAGDKSGERQYYRNDPIYTVLEEKNGYLKVRYHKLSSGVTGWFKKSDVKAYKTGVKDILNSEMAWTQEAGTEFIIRKSDGAILTPLAKGDSVLNANASNNIWNMANNPSEFIKDSLGLDTTNIPNNSSVQNSYVQNLDKVVFNLPNVQNYSELLSEMQRDKNFEKLIMSMTVDRIAGRSSLAKGKAIR